jgi:lysophospholipase L1-like esterase
MGEAMSVVQWLKDLGQAGLGWHAAEHAGLGVTSPPWPMLLPTVLSSPPTVTGGTGGAASVISGSILHSAFLPSKMTILGGPTSRGVNYPNYLAVALGVYPQITSSSPTAVEFNFDSADATGRFEINMKGNGGVYRVLVRQPSMAWGAFSQYATRTLPNDGNIYRDLVTMGAAGAYQIRIEFYNVFLLGIQTAATDTVSAVGKKRKRYIVVGDSFTEPTIVDTGTSFTGSGGWVQQLAYLTGFDIWSAGSGGTGYVQTNGSRPKFFDRLANDVLAFKPDGVIFAGGINDVSSDTGVFQTQVQNCLAACAGKEIIVISPFCPKGIIGMPSQYFGYRDILKTAAAAVGAKFIDLLNYGGVPSFLASSQPFSTVLSSAYASGTNIIVADLPAYFKTGAPGLDNWYVKIANGSAIQYARQVSNITGTGPYTLNIGTALLSAMPAGSTVTLCGDAYQTGTGKQGSPVGDGNSERYTGSDGTHPTMAGHANIARCVADLWSQATS